MVQTHIEAFCKAKSQAEAAEIIGCSQSAVSQMLRNRRDVYIIETDDGTFTWQEIKRPKAIKAA